MIKEEKKIHKLVYIYFESVLYLFLSEYNISLMQKILQNKAIFPLVLVKLPNFYSLCFLSHILCNLRNTTWLSIVSLN